MISQEYWRLFLETGAPEAYISYARALRMEEEHVPDHTGTGAAGNGLP